jgi:OFA family oxalate/formate antiporter-like MFS transporter
MAAFFAGSFVVPYYITAIFDAMAALLAFFVLRPVIRSRIAREVPAAV